MMKKSEHSFARFRTENKNGADFGGLVLFMCWYRF
jgi:hypothetical protein